MKTQKLNALSWGQKFALIDTFKLPDAIACERMGLLPAELTTAKNLLKQGTFQIDTTFDTSRYHDIIFPPAKAAKPTKPTNATEGEPSTDATPKRRGRKGDKIAKAFLAISTTPVAIETFIATHGVSLAVLRQSKRFDTNSDQGTVRVRRHNGILSVWREVEGAGEVTPPAAEAAAPVISVPPVATIPKAGKKAKASTPVAETATA